MDKAHQHLVEQVLEAMIYACKNPAEDTLANAGYVMAEAAVNAVMEEEKCSRCGCNLQGPTLCDMCAKE